MQSKTFRYNNLPHKLRNNNNNNHRNNNIYFIFYIFVVPVVVLLHISSSIQFTTTISTGSSSTEPTAGRSIHTNYLNHINHINHNTMSSSDPLRPVVFCGPSGVGKGTLIQLLMERYPNDQFGFCVSHTTRPPRPGEVDGIHYHFTTIPQIQQDIQENKFIEYAEVHGKYYGTSIESVESVQKSGKICILDIDVQGVQKVKASQLVPSPRYIFIAPPSRTELELRLRNRNTESEEAIQTRLSNAQNELDYGQTSGNFDRVFVNADLQECFRDMVVQFQEWYPHLIAVVSEDEDKEKNDKNCTCSII